MDYTIQTSRTPLKSVRGHVTLAERNEFPLLYYAVVADHLRLHAVTARCTCTAQITREQLRILSWFFLDLDSVATTFTGHVTVKFGSLHLVSLGRKRQTVTDIICPIV